MQASPELAPLLRVRRFSHDKRILTFLAMNVPKKDIDPATELAEEDEEQNLPDLEPTPEIDLTAAPGPLAAGRAVIARHAKLAPASPGVYRMMDARGDVLYVG